MTVCTHEAKPRARNKVILSKKGKKSNNTPSKGKKKQTGESSDDDDDRSEDKESEVTAMLSSASQMVRAILTFKNEISPCIPPDYDAMKTFVIAFERPLQEAVELVVDGIADLEVGVGD